MSAQQYYNSSPNSHPQQQQQQQQPQYTTQQAPYSQQQNPQYTHPPQPAHHPPPRRTDTDSILPQGQDRAEQMEHMQSFEANARQTQDDKNQEALQREFPDVDSSLIAAIYGDNRDMSEVRETLQELMRGQQQGGGA
ncbi:MAG: hypothetical protein Q9227_002108 [Pyrenula ochraceoflavens]